MLLAGQGLIIFNLSRSDLISQNQVYIFLMDSQASPVFGVQIRPVDVCVLPVALANMCQQPNTSDILVWLSVDKKNRHLKIGFGYPDPLNIILDWVDPDPGTSAELGAVTMFNISEVVVANGLMTLDNLSNNSVLEYHSLPDTSRKLFGSMAGPNIMIAKKDVDRINLSINTPGKILYNKIRQKINNTFGGDVNMVYIRVTIGPDQGNSPGSPYVMEIWPPGKYSPIHDHADTAAVIKILWGEITSRYFNPLSSIHYGEPLPYTISIYQQGQAIYLLPFFRQTHQLYNHRSDTACITIQAYEFLADDYVHYETFDYYLPNDPNLHQFLPTSDFEYANLMQALRKESP